MKSHPLKLCDIRSAEQTLMIINQQHNALGLQQGLSLSKKQKSRSTQKRILGSRTAQSTDVYMKPEIINVCPSTV